MAFFVPLALGLGYAAHQFLFPASSTSATTASGAEAKLTIKDFIKLAVDTNNLVLVDSSGNTIISPSSTGTMITGNVNVAVTTNTAQGYSLSVYTEDNSTSMVHSNSTVTDEISSIDTVSGYNAETGIAELSANTWGFRNRTTSGLSNWFAVGENESNGTVIANTNTGNSLYCEALSYPLENTGCDVGSYDTHSVNFGAKVTDAIAAGTYTNNVVFSAVAKSEGTRYTLKFNPNGGDNTMGPRTVVKGSTLTLPTKGFIKEGYVIKGWALTQADAEAKTENPSATTTNPTYSAGQTLEVTNLLLAATSAGQAVEQNALINLYAIWEEDVSYFQTTDICSTLPTGATSTLRDSRDNQDYTVYRWGSNAPAGMSNYCLMTKDLSLGYVTGGSVTKDADLTLTTDTSAAAGTISARTGTSDWSTDNSDDN
ncbi:InlB B-repeat-containing protein, partial [Candidatus Saccharibacteria bacterium]|nr:InlB B-repeat-containing protein [Candidatus Saccharibacteria bacterium]